MFPTTLTSRLKNQIVTRLKSYTTIVQNILVVTATFVSVFFLSLFLYGTFYYYYVPIVTQEKSVYFHFRVCDNGVGMCSFPVANISLTKEGKNEIFSAGQLYKIILGFDLPESDTNRNLGMFMIEMRLYNKTGQVVQTASRSSMLHYKSNLLQTLETIVFSPFFLLGYMNQKQTLHVELFTEFMDNTYNPSVGLVIEIQSQKAEIYSATLKIFAEFSGIRYLLYYWPITSAVVGISWNFILISFIVLLSWYHFSVQMVQDNNQDEAVKINIMGKWNQKVLPKKAVKVLSREAVAPNRFDTETTGADIAHSEFITDIMKTDVTPRRFATETIGAGGGTSDSDETVLLTPAPSSSGIDKSVRLRQPHSTTS